MVISAFAVKRPVIHNVCPSGQNVQLDYFKQLNFSQFRQNRCLVVVVTYFSVGISTLNRSVKEEELMESWHGTNNLL